MATISGCLGEGRELGIEAKVCELRNQELLKHNRNRYEYQVLVWLSEALPANVKVLIVADRGFGTHGRVKFDYLIGFRGNIKVTAAGGETRAAVDWVGEGGRMRILRGAAVTAEDYRVGAVVCVQAKDMKEPWCLATSLHDENARVLLKKYAKRWSIECSFRDTKDPHFGMGMAQIRISSPERRDRLWLLNALAVTLLTLLGAAGEALGFDKHLKASTTKRRTHSVFQGLPALPTHADHGGGAITAAHGKVRPTHA